MAQDVNRVEDEAAAWLIRLRGPASSADWEAFTAWLEADPAHGDAYDMLALADADLDALPRATPAPIPIVAEPRRTNRRAFLGWGGAAIAAAMVGAITLLPANGTYEVATGPGERQVVALEDGSRIEINGSSRVVLDRDAPRFARVESGEALFTVVHDDARPFRVEAGAARLVDLGTVFNVLHSQDRTEVAVSEGAVEYARGRESVRLDAGMSLRQQGDGPAEVSRVEHDAVGAWRQGRLSFSAASYADVAADLSRNLGVEIAADAGVADRRFSGVIVIDSDPAVMMNRVGALLEVSPRRAGDGWILAESGAPR